VQLALRFLDSEQAYQGVLDGTLEIAIVTLAPEPHEQLEVVPIWTDRMCFVCAADHPLRHAPALTLAKLCQHASVLPGAQTFTRALLRRRLEASRLELNASMSTNYLETLKMMCSVGLGWSLLPESMIDHELVELDVDTPPLYRPLGYLVHKNRTLSNAARRLIEELEETRESSVKHWTTFTKQDTTP
jgi:DNA-binding transcriptional LysR family regulator